MPLLPRRDFSPLLPISLAQATGLLCGLAGVKLSTWLVPPDDFGRYGVFLTFTPVGMWVVHAGIIQFVSRHWAAAPDRGALLRAVAAAFWRKMPWLVAAAAATTALMGGRAGWTVFPFVLVAAFFLSVGTVAQTALQAGRRHWNDLAVAATGSLTRSFLPPLLFAAAGGSVFALYGGYCLHAFALASAGVLTLRLWWRPAGMGAAAVAPVYEGPMFVALSATAWILSSLGRWIMAAFFGAGATGYFVLAGNLAALVPTMLGAVIFQFFQPDFFADASEGGAPRKALAARVDRVAFGHAALSLAGLASLRLIAPWLIGPLISARYADALPWLLPAGAFATATMTASFYHSLLLAGRRERSCLPVDLSTAALLATGCLASAAAGMEWFARWMMLAPIVPWLLTRTLARRHYFAPP